MNLLETNQQIIFQPMSCYIKCPTRSQFFVIRWIDLFTFGCPTGRANRRTFLTNFWLIVSIFDPKKANIWNLYFLNKKWFLGLNKECWFILINKKCIHFFKTQFWKRLKMLCCLLFNLTLDISFLGKYCNMQKGNKLK